MVLAPEELKKLTPEEEKLKKQLDGIVEDTLRKNPNRADVLSPGWKVTVNVSLEQFPLPVIHSLKQDYIRAGWLAEWVEENYRGEGNYLRFTVPQKPTTNYRGD